MEHPVLEPETARTVELPAPLRIFARNREIRRHFARLGISAYPWALYTLRHELVESVDAHYKWLTSLARQALEVEVLTDLVVEDFSVVPEETLPEQGEQLHG